MSRMKGLTIRSKRSKRSKRRFTRKMRQTGGNADMLRPETEYPGATKVGRFDDDPDGIDNLPALTSAFKTP